MTGFAEAEGAKGTKTRTWFTVRECPIFAWAGMWKDSDEWGAVYSGLMTDANEVLSICHNRVPVLLHAHEYDLWLKGSLDHVRAFQNPVFPAELQALERTTEPWFKPPQGELTMRGG